MVLLLVLPGVAFNFWFWRVRVRTTRREAAEKASYLSNPVGRIVPRFDLRYLRTPGGELQVSGQVNLPEGTILDVEVYAGDLLLAVDSPVTIQNGALQTRPLLQRGRPFTPGSYGVRIRATFGEGWQPPQVLLVVGPKGERLAGPQINRTDASSGAKLEFADIFDLNP